VLKAYCIDAVGTGEDFLTISAPPTDVDAVVTNPPYGVQGRLAEAFIAHALELVPFAAMLLRNDFDSGKTRQGLFRHNPYFAGKLVLLDRVRWFDGPSSPSDNHAWFIFDRGHHGPPVIRYTRNSETETVLPASTRWLPSTVGQQGASGRGVTATVSSKGPKDHE
jgi:predicted RNA methylase